MRKVNGTFLHRFRDHRWLLPILLLAAFFRLYQPGLYKFWIDEEVIHHSAIQLARHGQWTWVGNPASFVMLDAHSPLTTYLIAIPYLFSPDPQMARAFVGLFGIATVATMYWLVRRYYGQMAALWAALLVAVFPQLISNSRFVWNPNLDGPFIILWMLTGLQGYYEGHRKAQIIHWVMLGMAIQTQASLAVLAPLSLFLLGFRWFSATDQRIHTIRNTLYGFVLTGVTLIPWIVGLVGVRLDMVKLPGLDTNQGASGLIVSFPDLGTVWHGFSTMAGGANFFLNTLNISSVRAFWWPPRAVNPIFQVQAILILVMIVWFNRRIYRKQVHFPTFFISIVAIWPLVYYLLGQTKIIGFNYMNPVPLAAVALLVIGLNRAATYSRGATVLLVIFVGAHGWLAAAHLHWYTANPEILGVSDVQALVRDWHEIGDEIVILEEPTDEPNMARVEWELYWRILSEEYPLRFVSHTHAFPIAPGGQVIASIASGQTIPMLFGEGDIAYRPQRDFRYLFITPKDIPQPDFIPEDTRSFGDLLQLSGIIAEAPEAGQQWPVMLIWEPQRGTEQQYQFSVRLMDTDGNGYGQVDGETLQPALWRHGDMVLTRLFMTLPDTLPEDQEWQFQVLVYSWPDVHNIPLLDSAGNPSGDILTLNQRSD